MNVAPLRAASAKRITESKTPPGRGTVAMNLRLLSIGACLVLAVTFIGCSGGNDKPAALPEKGAELCTELKKVERMRYTIGYTLESPRQASPPDDVTATDWAVKPSHPDFKFETGNDGSFVQPDKLDFMLSTPGEQSVRTIIIGQNEWFLLNGGWVPSNQPVQGYTFTPPLMCDALVSQLDVAGRTATTEKVGDTDAQHIRIEAAPIAAAAQLFTEQSDNGKLLKSWDVDLWLSKKDASLVKVEAVAKANYPYGRELSSKLSLQVGSFNDDNIVINQPI